VLVYLNYLRHRPIKTLKIEIYTLHDDKLCEQLNTFIYKKVITIQKSLRMRAKAFHLLFVMV
jgi:hypothetical protein